MGYSRAGNRRVAKVLTRATYTNFGNANTDYYFLNNGSSGSLSVQLKSYSGNFVAGDRIKIGNYIGGANNFLLTTQNPDEIKIGLSANSTMENIDYQESITVTKNAPIEITWLRDNFNNLHAVVTEKAE